MLFISWLRGIKGKFHKHHFDVSFSQKVEYVPINQFKAYKDLKQLNPHITHLDSYLESFIYGYLIGAGKFFEMDNMIDRLKDDLAGQKIKYCEKLDFTRYVKMTREKMGELGRVIECLSPKGTDEFYAYSFDYHRDWVYIKGRVFSRELYDYIKTGKK